MSLTTEVVSTTASKVITICGVPNSGKTTIFNAMTGLSQRVANYPGVTVEKVSGRFSIATSRSDEFTIIDIPGTYSLTPYSPDERIATAALCGLIEGERLSDAIICVVDATNLERGLCFVFQVMQIGRPVVVALNMIDLAKRLGIQIDSEKLSKELGGIPVVPVIGTRGQGLAELKRAVAESTNADSPPSGGFYDESVEELLSRLAEINQNGHKHRAELLRIIFDVENDFDIKETTEEQPTLDEIIKKGRRELIATHGSLSAAGTATLSKRASEICAKVITKVGEERPSLSDKLDMYLLHPVLGPSILFGVMILMFQSIFSWAEPLMNGIDSLFASLAGLVQANMTPGPFQSLITDGIIGGVGSVIIFLPQIVILFMFISILEDTGYLSRAAFMVDKMFHWCGLSGKSFIPLLSSYACAIPGIMATRTIEDRKLRLITIMVAPLMTCSARLPVYAIMIAAFIPYQAVLGIFNLQGLVLTALYFLGLIVAVIISFILKKVMKSEQSSFMMEMPSYKLPTMRSVVVRVVNRSKLFLKRAGTIIAAITVIIWALSYYPHSDEITAQFAEQYSALESAYQNDLSSEQYKAQVEIISNQEAGAHLANSYFGRMGRTIEPLFEPLGWDWKITLAALASFPAREVVIATLGTIYNLGEGVDEESSSLVTKMREARRDHGEKQGLSVFSPAVALSIMVFFALCCQCGATLVTIKQETGKLRYSVFVFAYMTTLAYIGALITYQVFNGIGL
jgi:ferrous iron transport protein B